MIRSVLDHFPFHSPHKKLIIRYYTYHSGYKDYCQGGEEYRPPAPKVCPICRSNDCLIRHGRYQRIELVTGYDKKYGGFYIYRFLCKNSGRTLSMHPDFCAAYKRHLLEYVIYLLEEYILKEKNLYQLCNEHSLYRRTLKRWLNGFQTNETAKRIAVLPRSTGPPGLAFLKELFLNFVKCGKGNSARGAASVMVRLFHDFSCHVY